MNHTPFSLGLETTTEKGTERLCKPEAVDNYS